MELLSHQLTTVSEIFSEFPSEVISGDITLYTDDINKLEIIQRLASEPSLQQGARVSTIDGIRSDFEDGWGLVRASNHSPKLTLRFAGNNQEAMERIQLLYKNALIQHSPQLDIPF